MPRRKLDLSLITADPAAQARVRMDEGLVEDLAQAALAGEELPDLDVVGDGGTYHVWDGFHRLEGYRRSGVTHAWCMITPGTLGDARWLACSANREARALRRTNEDKRRAVGMALAQRPDLSDRAIAEHVGVSHEFVRQLRSGGQVSTVDTSATRTGTDGKQYPVKAAQPAAPAIAPAGQAEGPAGLVPLSAAGIEGLCRGLLSAGASRGWLAGALRDAAGRVERGELRADS